MPLESFLKSIHGRPRNNMRIYFFPMFGFSASRSICNAAKIGEKKNENIYFVTLVMFLCIQTQVRYTF